MRLWLLAAAVACAVPQGALAQDAGLNLKGAIDFHVHQAPDSVQRAIDADDLARLAKSHGIRALVMKNHREPTASLAFLVRKIVPGIEVFGGIAQNLAVGGINLEAVKRMTAVTGGYGRIVWLPTFDNDTPAKRAAGTPYVPVSQDGKLLPNVLELIAWIGTQPQLVLETGHVTPQEGLMVIREARARGVRQVVVTHAPDLGWTVPQMREAAAEGAYLEFVYHSTLGNRQTEKLKTYAETIKAVGPRHCIMATDLGDVPPGTNYPLEPQGFLEFMQAMHKEGIPVADINLMTKTNPARALGLEP
jgi:uncharacterized protein DUF6282